MRTVFRLSSHKDIFNGLLNATERLLTISASPPCKYGAIIKASQMTGITPQAYKIIFVFESLSVLTGTSPLFPLSRCIKKLYEKFINIFGRLVILQKLISELIKAVYQQIVFKPIKCYNSLFFFRRATPPYLSP